MIENVSRLLTYQFTAKPYRVSGMVSYLLRHPEKKRIVDMKSFAQERRQCGNHRDRSKERVPNRRILHFKSNSRIKVKEHRSGDLARV